MIFQHCESNIDFNGMSILYFKVFFCFNNAYLTYNEFCYLRISKQFFNDPILLWKWYTLKKMYKKLFKSIKRLALTHYMHLKIIGVNG